MLKPDSRDSAVAVEKYQSKFCVKSIKIKVGHNCLQQNQIIQRQMLLAYQTYFEMRNGDQFRYN